MISDIKLRIGTKFILPLYPKDLPPISETENKEGIVSDGYRIYRVNWKENGLLKSIIFMNRDITAIGTYRIENEDSEFPKLHQCGEWIELDKNQRIKRIFFYSYYGETVYEVIRLQNIIISRVYDIDGNYTITTDKFVSTRKRKKNETYYQDTH